MNWSDIIKAIMAVVGPLLKKWLADWLDNLLKSVAADLTAGPESTVSGRARALLAEAHDSLWWFQFPKRRLLTGLLTMNIPAVVQSGAELLPVEVEKIRVLAAKCG